MFFLFSIRELPPADVLLFLNGRYHCGFISRTAQRMRAVIETQDSKRHQPSITLLDRRCRAVVDCETVHCKRRAVRSTLSRAGAGWRATKMSAPLSANLSPTKSSPRRRGATAASSAKRRTRNTDSRVRTTTLSHSACRNEIVEHWCTYTQKGQNLLHPDISPQEIAKNQSLSSLSLSASLAPASLSMESHSFSEKLRG